MKKILLVIHGTNYPDNAIAFINQLNKKQKIALTGFFLPSIIPIENWAAYSELSVGVLEDVTTSANMKQFEESCREYNIQYNKHIGGNELAIDQIIKETRFTDLLIADSTAFYKEEGIKDPYPYLEKVMHLSECPMLVIPDHSSFPERVILYYDASKASVFAIKQFAHLLPELCSLETRLLYKLEKANADIPHKNDIEEWCKIHFSNFSMRSIDDKEYANILTTGSGILAVSGSYSRSAVSEWLNKSFSKDMLKGPNTLLFTSHS